MSERHPGAEPGGGRARRLVLVGCGKMGTAMLRGWIAAGVASRCVVVEPAGMPAVSGSVPELLWCPSPDELPTEPRPDAVVFAVKPQIADDVVPKYRRWADSETLFASIIAGKTLAGLARHLGRAAIVRTTPSAVGDRQMLPRQTNSSFMRASCRVAPHGARTDGFPGQPVRQPCSP